MCPASFLVRARVAAVIPGEPEYFMPGITNLMYNPVTQEYSYNTTSARNISSLNDKTYNANDESINIVSRGAFGTTPTPVSGLADPGTARIDICDGAVVLARIRKVVFFFDTFARSDRNLNGDNGWVSRNGSSWAIVSNKAAPTAIPSETGYGALTRTLKSKPFVMNANVSKPSTSAPIGLVLRGSGDNYLLVSFDSTGVKLFKVEAGVFTLLGTFSTQTFSGSFPIKVTDAANNTISVSAAYQSLGSITTTEFSNQIDVGVYSGPDLAVRVDDFTAD